MTRVSLREAYDNKDVVAQIYAIRDIAESAVDTSEQAVTTANTASDHVDALVPQVEGAVENANSASASAQASAQTVAGYENRLATVEDATEDLAGDLNAVTLRVTTAEGDIVTIQGRVTAIEGNYLKKSGDPQTVVSQIDVPTTATGVRDTQIANGTRIQNDLDNYAGMIRNTGNQSKAGILTMDTALIIGPTAIFDRGTPSINFPNEGKAKKMVEFTEGQPTGQYHTAVYLMTPIRSNVPSRANKSGILMLTNNTSGSPMACWMVAGSEIDPSKYIITKEGGLVTLWTTDGGSSDGFLMTKLSDTRTAGASYGFNASEDTNEYTITSAGYDDGTVYHTFDSYVPSVIL